MKLIFFFSALVLSGFSECTIKDSGESSKFEIQRDTKISPAVDVFVIEAVGILPASVAENAGTSRSRSTVGAAVLSKEFSSFSPHESISS